MTAPAGRTRAQAACAVASACITGVAIAVMSMIWSSPSRAQTVTTPTTPTSSGSSTTTTLVTTTTTTPEEWAGSRWTGPTANGETVSDATFSGTFVHTPPTPSIEAVELNIEYGAGDTHAATCGSAPSTQLQSAPTTSTSTPSGDTTSTMNFLFEVPFVCNGIYNATATATLENNLDNYDMTLTGLHIAEPPQSPLSFLATDNGNRTVTLTWQAPNQKPPDLAGYRVSRRDANASDYSVSVDVATDVFAYNDTNIPAGGGSYFYKVETLRSSPNGTLTSNPVVTSEALNVGANPTGTPGQSVGGVPAPRADSGGSGVQHFDDTLAADEGEPGEGDFAVPGGDTIQRFAGRDGAGLVKPFAAALDLAVWAGLMLFLTRRAASAERAAVLAIELEHPRQQRGGPGLVEGLVPVAALGGLDARGAPVGTSAPLDDLQRGGEVPVGHLVPEFGDPGAARVAVVDEDRRPTRVRLKHR
jgi:hypothetical protein